MTLEVWFWVIMFLWLVVGLWLEWTPGYPYVRAGRHVLIFILLLILGWRVFGSPVK